MAVEREDIQYRGHRIIANATGAMIYPDKHRFDADGMENVMHIAKAWIDAKYQERSKSRRAPHIGTIDDYAEALNSLSLGKHEHAMLVAHRKAVGRKLTALELSNSAGWEGVGPANIHYGYLGRRIAEHLGLAITDKDDHACTEAVAQYDENTHQWEMYEEVALAMDRLNIK